ncbi:PAS domain-containing protein [Silicimonas algicola]|uniref:PAS domain-containing protein n=1 Tax=Silicimonas algicola TaxID=1826607 RepID=A0A316G6V4_9RHOB|nr:PAS domain-containing protein [Silicimonas algicola]
MLFNIVTVAGYVLGAGLAAYAALLFLSNRSAIKGDHDAAPLLFLIRDGAVTDANFAGGHALVHIDGPDAAIDRLRLLLTRGFDNPGRLIAPPDSEGDITAESRDGRLQATRHVVGESIRLKLRQIVDGTPSSDDIHVQRAIESELETLRANTAAAPFLLWRQNADGEITWANRAYMTAIETSQGAPHKVWPLPTLFPSLRTTALSRDGQRISLHDANGHDEAWYDCHVAPVGPDLLCTAIPADEAVRSENRRREFTQTLTKTFAELATGLAIFDRERRLVLFNPALLDLTNLPSDFLTSKPSLVGFLDRLRENRVMPEPRDYRSWRTSIAELEAAAADGTYSETWSLPDGQTYHVTGRPHPDGAVALLFEDISAEMSLTRRFRAELERSQAIIDAMDDAVAAFSAAGRLALTNRAYRDLWGDDGADGLVGREIGDVMRRWHALSQPSPAWGDFRDYAQRSHDREEWTANVTMLDGRHLACRFVPQKGGETLAIFRVQTSSPVEVRFRHAV